MYVCMYIEISIPHFLYAQMTDYKIQNALD